MKYLLKCGLVFVFAAIMFAGAVVPATAGDTVELLVVTRQGVQNNLQWPSCVVRVRRIPGAAIYRVWVQEGCAAETIRTLEGSPLVRSVERAGRIPISDMHLGRAESTFHGSGSWTTEPVAGVGPNRGWRARVNARAISRLGDGSGTIVAVLDTGIDLVNPFFAARLWHNPGEIPDDGLDNDRNGYIDDENGWNFGDGDNDLQDTEGHGTEVASFVLGMAPQCSLLPLKINRGGADTFGMGALIEGMYYAVSAGARVINMSFSASTYSAALAHAMEDARNAGAILVGAAGNSGWTVEFPANLDDVLAVGALAPDGSIAWFSSIGPELDLTAPGDAILATGLGGVREYVSGTSFSTPIVSGAAAVLRSMNPHLKATTVKKLLLAGTRDLGTPGFDLYYGAGALDGALLWGAALPRVMNTTPPFFMHARKEPLSLKGYLPPTDTDAQMFLVLASGSRIVWLDENGEWHDLDNDSLLPFFSSDLYSEAEDVLLFGDGGLFPPLDVHSWDAGSYRWGIALEDASGRLLAPIGWTTMVLF